MIERHTAFFLLALLAAYALFAPREHIVVLAALSFLVAFFSASQDIVIDAFRREILPERELGLGNSVHVAAYRISAFVPGALSLILAEHMSWAQVFLITALFMLPALMPTTTPS